MSVCFSLRCFNRTHVHMMPIIESLCPSETVFLRPCWFIPILTFMTTIKKSQVIRQYKWRLLVAKFVTNGATPVVNAWVRCASGNVSILPRWKLLPIVPPHWVAQSGLKAVEASNCQPVTIFWWTNLHILYILYSIFYILYSIYVTIFWWTNLQHIFSIQDQLDYHPSSRWSSSVRCW